MSDRCVRFARRSRSSDAKALLMEAARRSSESSGCRSRDAAGRVLARPLISTIDVPPFDRAAMDGYAVHRRGHVRRRPLRRRGCCTASRKSTRDRCRRDACRRGECIEIATGAPMPEGADAVVMVEETERATDGTFAYSCRCIRGSTSGAVAPTSPPDKRSARRHRCSTRAASACSPPSAWSTSTSTRSPRSPSCPPETRSSSPGSPSSLDRSTTSTGSRLRRSFMRTVASAMNGATVPENLQTC